MSINFAPGSRAGASPVFYGFFLLFSFFSSAKLCVFCKEIRPIPGCGFFKIIFYQFITFLDFHFRHFDRFFLRRSFLKYTIPPSSPVNRGGISPFFTNPVHPLAVFSSLTDRLGQLPKAGTACLLLFCILSALCLQGSYSS